MAIEKTGLMAVFETAEFQKGLDTYLNGLAQVNSATDATSKETSKSATGVRDVGDAADTAGSKIAGISQFLGTAGSAITGIAGKTGAFAGILTKAGGVLTSLGGIAGSVAAGPLAVLGAGIVALLGGISLVIKGIKEFITILQAAAAEAPKLEGIGKAFEGNAARFNVSLAEMRNAAAGTISDFELMRQANVALTGATGQFAQEFGAKLPALLEGARAAAKATGQDVDFLFESLVTGVKRSSPLLIDNTGIVLKLGEANQAMADQLGITVEQLTEEEKQLALLNATVDASIALAEQQGTSQRTAAENAAAADASMKNFQDTLGQFMIPIITKLSGVWANFTQALAESVQEGGFLFPLITEIAARLSILADVAAMVGNSLIQGFRNIAALFTNITGEISMDVEGLIIKFATWGAEMMAALADGIVQGASAALTAAMNVVQNLLTYWLAPGSPPKVVPHIDKWGAATFTEYMKGFSDADFGVLTGLQSILGKILNKPELQSLSIDISAAIAEGGPDEAFFSKLRTAAGDFGNEVVKLAENYFELADAQEESKRAQNQLNDAMKAMEESESTVDALTQEYNRLLRAGASDEVLDAQLAQINAAEDQLRLAREQKAQAEENIATTEERIKAIAEETGLQEELVNQLLALAAEQEKVAGTGAGVPGAERATGAAGGLAREMGGLGAGIGGAMGEGITTGIQDAIENAKKLLLEKLGRIFAPLKQRWEESIKPTLEELLKKFNEFKDDVIEAWEVLKENVGIVVDDLSLWWEVILPNAITILKTAIDNLKTKFQLLWNYITITLIPKLSELANDIFGGIRDAIAIIAEKITGDDGLIASFKKLRDFVADKLSSAFRAFKETYVDPLTEAFGNLWDRLDAVNRIVQIIKQTIEWILGNQNRVTGGGGGTQQDVRNAATTGRDIVPVTVNVIPATAMAGGGNITQNRFDFGGNNISDGIDLAMFEEMIVRVLRRELSR